MSPPAPKRVAPDSPGARRLIALADAYLGALYPPEANSLESVEALQRPEVCFLGVEDNGTLVACGAVKFLNDVVAYGEIKRLFVLPEHRGKGHGRSILLALESELRARGIHIVRLETGVSQPESLGLYASLGYRVRGAFGAYPVNAYSVFMEKVIQPVA